MTANAIYTNADQTVDLVVLDDADSVLEVLEENISDDRETDIYVGDTEYRVVGHIVEIGDGDIFRRLVLR